MKAAKKQSAEAVKVQRPMPPRGLLIKYDNRESPPAFAPAKDMPEWVLNTFLEPSSKLFNQGQYHLYDFMDGTQITFLWASTGFESKGRYVAGQCEEVRFMCNKWQKWRQEQQMQEWFGIILPTFMITLDASYWNECSDVEACALIEHELLHVGQEYIGDQPQFSKDTGLPKLKMRGHCVEEFVDIVARYGPGHKLGAINRMVEAANAGPLIANVDVAHACGTCLRAVK